MNHIKESNGEMEFYQCFFMSHGRTFSPRYLLYCYEIVPRVSFFSLRSVATISIPHM